MKGINGAAVDDRRKIPRCQMPGCGAPLADGEKYQKYCEICLIIRDHELNEAGKGGWL